jgi:outer membrane protein TolC
MNLKEMKTRNSRKAEIPRQKKPLVLFAGGLKYLSTLIAAMLLCATLSVQETAAQETPAQGASVQGTEVQPLLLSPDEAVERAIRNNLSLESSRTNLETRRRASQYSWNQFIPDVMLIGSLSSDNSRTFLYNESDIPSAMLDQMRNQLETSRLGISGTIQASLNISIAMFESMNRLRLDYEGGLLSYERAKAQLERDVRKMYHSMLMQQEYIAMLYGSLENTERQVKMAQANYDAGLAPELTLLQARVARENMRPTIDQEENVLKLLMAQFAMYLGLDYDTPFELIPVTNDIDFIPLDVAEMIRMASSSKPDILELRHTILVLESARKAQINSLLPTLTLIWNTVPYFPLNPKPETTINFANPSESIFNPAWNISNQFTIRLTFRLHSLIPFSTDSQGIRNTNDQITTTNINLAQLIRGTEIEIYNTILSLERIRVSTEAQAQTVNLAEQSYRLTEMAYEAGLQDLFQVQSAEQSLRQARFQMLVQQFNYLNGLIDLEYSIGVPFGTLSRRELSRREQ